MELILVFFTHDLDIAIVVTRFAIKGVLKHLFSSNVRTVNVALVWFHYTFI